MKISLLPHHLKVYFNQLSEIAFFSKQSWYYSTSHFFSKVGAYEALTKYLGGERVTYGMIIYQICKYILKVNTYFFLHVIFKIVHILSRQKSMKTSTNVVYVDTFIVVNYSLKNSNLIDNYFPGLLRVIDERKREHVIIPRLYGSFNPLALFALFRKIKENNSNVLTEFELLRFIDFVNLGIYLIIYPFKMLRLYQTKILSMPDNDFLRYYFWFDMNGSNFFGGVRYLFAKKLLNRLQEKNKIIQWFENQPYEKALNRVLNESKKKLDIYGCQLYIYPLEGLNAYIDPKDFNHHLPQHILVNGKYYIEEDNPNFSIGPSIRYMKLFQTPVYQNFNKEILVLFSYFESSNNMIIRMMNSLELDNVVPIKFHPSNSIEKIKSKITFNFKLIDSDIYSRFTDTELVIGAASGSLVEAAACGIPVLVVGKGSVIDYSYLPEFCKGILWDVVWDEKSFNRCSEQLKFYVQNNPEKRMNMIRKLREEIFYEPSDQRILKAFDL